MDHHTTTSLARLAASRAVDVTAGGAHTGPRAGDSRPLPELSLEAPEWLQVYQSVRVASPSRERNTSLPSAPMLLERRAPRPSPYAQDLGFTDGFPLSSSPRRVPQKAIPFEGVYGQKGDSHGEFAAALLSLTSLGQARGTRNSAAPSSAPAFAPIRSKFPIKDGPTERRDRHEAGAFVSGGQG